MSAPKLQENWRIWNGQYNAMNGKIKTVIFDIGYTLLEYRECRWPDVLDQGLQQAYHNLRDKSLTLTPYVDFKSHFEDIKERHRVEAARALAGWRASDVVRELFRRFEIPFDEESILAFLDSLYAPSRDLMYIQNDTAESLNELKKAGLGLGIISNTIYPPSFHLADLKILGLSSYFDFTIFSSASPHRKPHPTIFEAAIDKTGAAAEETVYVGDRYDLDVLGAQTAGMRPILKYCPRQAYPDPLPADLPVIYSIGELIDRLVSADII